MVDIFKALSEESRLRIIAILMEEEMCVCDIEESLNLTQSNASRHLTVLRNCGILESNKKAQWNYFTVSSKFIRENQDLWSYLSSRLKELPTYQADIVKCHSVCDVEKCK